MRLVPTLILAASLAAGQLQACGVAGTSVEDVYPTGRELPENLLRFYIYFSAPMGQDDILSAIDLLDSDGAPLGGVFLSNRFDLWSPDRRRLTLLMDPGRVKTGLAANVAMGRALVAGETYSLRVSAHAQDAKGCPLIAPHVVTFTASAADITSPNPANWTLDVPDAGTRTPMAVMLDDPVDHLSLAYRLRITDQTGDPVAGRIDLDDAETRWIFTPSVAWRSAPYNLNIDPRLEDLAGNRFDAVFDLDLGTDGQSMLASTSRTLSFTPTAP